MNDKKLNIMSKIMRQDLTKIESKFFYSPKDLIPLLKKMTNFQWVDNKEKFDQIEEIVFTNIKKIESDKQLSINLYNKVVLLSGGIDSLAGVSFLLKNDLINGTIFITYNTGNGDIKNAQKIITKLFESGYNILYYPFSKSNLQIEKRIASKQRTRSFWFLTFANYIAEKFSIDEIFVFENGFVSLNSGVTIDRSFTKTTHPDTIHLMKLYFNKKITTPFQFLTKSEVLRFAISNDFTNEFIKNSNTCSNSKQFINIWLKPKNNSNEKFLNCGICYSCLVRRIAEFDNKYENTKYAIDFADKKLTKNISNNFISLQLYFDKIIELTNNEKIKFYIPRKNKDKYIEMYKRFVKEIEGFRW